MKKLLLTVSIMSLTCFISKNIIALPMTHDDYDNLALKFREPIQRTENFDAPSLKQQANVIIQKYFSGKTIDTISPHNFHQILFNKAQELQNLGNQEGFDNFLKSMNNVSQAYLNCQTSQKTTLKCLNPQEFLQNFLNLMYFNSTYSNIPITQK